MSAGRRTSPPLALRLCLLIALVAAGAFTGAIAGCGGDNASDQVEEVTAPPLTAPGDIPDERERSRTETTETEPEVAPQPTPGSEGTGGSTPQTGGGEDGGNTGGAAPPRQGQEGSQRGSAPPRPPTGGTPAERFEFEKFCQENPGSC